MRRCRRGGAWCHDWGRRGGGSRASGGNTRGAVRAGTGAAAGEIGWRGYGLGWVGEGARAPRDRLAIGLGCIWSGYGGARRGSDGKAASPEKVRRIAGELVEIYRGVNGNLKNQEVEVKMRTCVRPQRYLPKDRDR